MTNQTIQLKDAKVGDRVLIEFTITGFDNKGFVGLRPTTGDIPYANVIKDDVTATRLPPPPVDLVEGQRISHRDSSACKGKYLGRGWVWWDDYNKPSRLAYSPNTSNYEVLTDV